MIGQYSARYVADNKNPCKNEKMIQDFIASSLRHKIFIEKIDDDEYKYKVEIEIGEFRPNDIKIKLKGKKLTINASRKTEENDIETEVNETIKPNATNLKEFEQFKREVELPDFLILETVNCFLETYEDSQSMLVIEALIDPNSDILKNESYLDQLKIRDVDKEDEEPRPSILKNRSSSKPSLKKSSQNNLKQPKSFENLTENELNSDFNQVVLKYKFDLNEFDSKNISISIKNKNVLVVYAVRKCFNDKGRIYNKEFNREIVLPESIEIYNIRNCFDEASGILRIEIPLKQERNNHSSSFEDDEESAELDNDYYSYKTLRRDPDGSQKRLDKDRYLELMFDLNNFKFENFEFLKNEQNKNILVVKASKSSANNYSYSHSVNYPYLKKYILPDWVSTKNVKVHQDSQITDGEKKNLLILQLPIIS